MLVVPRNNFPTWAAILLILLVTVAVAILGLIITGGRGTVLVVAIPGFPVESLVIGLMIGVFLILFRRRSVRKSSNP